MSSTISPSQPSSSSASSSSIVAAPLPMLIASGARPRKPKRIFRYMEGLVSEQEKAEFERAEAEAAAAAEDEETALTAAAEGGAARQAKRSKVSRACRACKISHMSCQEQRPCLRCIQRGIGDRCCDSEQDMSAILQSQTNQQSPKAGHNSVSSGPIHVSSAGGLIDATMADPGLMNVGMTPSVSLTGPTSATPLSTSEQTFDAMMAFLGSMDAATADWGPVPSSISQHDLSNPSTSPSNSSIFQHSGWFDIPSTPSNVPAPNQLLSSADASQRAAVRTSNSPATPSTTLSSVQPASNSTERASSANVAASPSSTKALSESLDAKSKPFISGNLSEYRADPLKVKDKPWKDIYRPDWSATADPEDSIIRPYNYSYGYQRIERWIRSPLSGYSDDNADRVKHVLDLIRPLIRSRWSTLTDLQLVQHEERHDAVVEHYRSNVAQAVPLPLFVIRRTCEIVCANDAFAKLCNCHPSAFTTGRLCLYQMLEQAFMVEIFEKMSDYLVKDVETPIQVRGRLKFTCTASSSSPLSKQAHERSPQSNLSTLAATATATSTTSATNAPTIQLRQICATVILSMEAVMDEHKLPLCFVCTLTPLQDGA